jgi:hypothetical protein
MKKSMILAAGAAMVAAVLSFPIHAEEGEAVFGRQLMTQEELQQHRQTMQGLATKEERQQYRKEHHQRMLERARERGVTLPEEPGKQGKGMGPKPGKGEQKGQGAGQGQGTGTPQGDGRGAPY